LSFFLVSFYCSSFFLFVRVLNEMPIIQRYNRANRQNGELNHPGLENGARMQRGDIKRGARRRNVHKAMREATLRGDTILHAAAEMPIHHVGPMEDACGNGYHHPACGHHPDGRRSSVVLERAIRRAMARQHVVNDVDESTTSWSDSEMSEEATGLRLAWEREMALHGHRLKRFPASCAVGSCVTGGGVTHHSVQHHDRIPGMDAPLTTGDRGELGRRHFCCRATGKNDKHEWDSDAEAIGWRLAKNARRGRRT
jgi:hypothetical protein